MKYWKINTNSQFCLCMEKDRMPYRHKLDPKEYMR